MSTTNKNVKNGVFLHSWKIWKNWTILYFAKDISNANDFLFSLSTKRILNKSWVQLLQSSEPPNSSCTFFLTINNCRVKIICNINTNF